MTHPNLIYGINPLVISRIIGKRGYRIGRTHPYKTLLKKKKYPFLAKIGFFEDDNWGCFRNPEVHILGSDGDPIQIITCRSNKHAEKLRDDLVCELNKKLTDYQGVMKHETKS
jgi:hypothetical protein